MSVRFGRLLPFRFGVWASRPGAWLPEVRRFVVWVLRCSVLDGILADILADILDDMSARGLYTLGLL